MDPLSLAAAVVGLLVPLFKQAAGRLAERSGESVADAAIPAVKALFARVRARLAPDKYRGALLDGLQAEPNDTERQQILKSELAKLIAQDEEFAAELARLVVEAEQAEGVQVTATDSGIVAGRDVYQQGQYIAGRDLTIGNMPEE